MSSIILFDGVCNLCNGAVNFIIDRDKNECFQFAALQSEVGKRLLKSTSINADNLKTIVLLEGENVYTQSTAALRIVKQLSFLWSLLYIFILIPKFIRDGCYRLVANNRYRWFGKSDHCRLPTPEYNKRFV